jgi:hypothetical protein
MWGSQRMRSRSKKEIEFSPQGENNRGFPVRFRSGNPLLDMVQCSHVKEAECLPPPE